MLDRDGYRPNVGIILCNARNEVFWGKRVREHSWQFPQGGIKPGESPEAAMYRELMEEVGLSPHHVKILGRTGRCRCGGTELLEQVGILHAAIGGSIGNRRISGGGLLLGQSGSPVVHGDFVVHLLRLACSRRMPAGHSDR